MDKSSIGLRRFAWKTTPTTVCLAPLERSLVHHAPHRCPSADPNKAPHQTESIIPHARQYKGDLASPLEYDSLSHTFLHTPLISYIDLMIGVLTCLKTPFVPLWDCFATTWSTVPLPLPPSTLTGQIKFYLAISKIERKWSICGSNNISIFLLKKMFSLKYFHVENLAQFF